MRGKRRLFFCFFPAADETLVLPHLDCTETAAMKFAARIGVGIVHAVFGFRFQEMIAVVEEAEQIIRVVVSVFHGPPLTQLT